MTSGPIKTHMSVSSHSSACKEGDCETLWMQEYLSEM